MEVFFCEKMSFLYNGENDIYYFPECDTWLYYTANM